MNTILNLDKRTFLISFSHRLSEGKFIFQDGKDFLNLLKQYDSKGIEYIKEFNYAKNNFIKVSKKDILNRFSWDTETALFLQNHYYFKK